MDVISDLAESIVTTRYENLPRQAVKIAREFIVDTIGVGIAGSGSAGNNAIIELLHEWGGQPESTVFVHGIRLPAPEAAFANSLLIHSADYDDTDDRTATHTNVCALPAALALAEKLHCDGKAVITAVALGVDLTCRLALASNLFHGWHNTSTVGIFGAAAAAGKTLGLDRIQMVNALGIAYSQAAGNRQGREDGAMTKRLQPAFATRAGVVAALLAQRGVTGARNVIQGQWGLFRLYRDYRRKYEPDQWAALLRDGLGTRFEGVNLSAKPYPCVRCAHAPIDGALELAAKHDLNPEKVMEVIVGTNERVLDTAGKPFAIRTDPEVDAKFSIPYVVAVALSKRKVTLADFKEEAIRTPALAALAAKVKVVLDPEFRGSRSVVGPVKVKVKMSDGRELATRVELARGHLQNPMNERDFANKFRECVMQSAIPIAEQKIERLLRLLNRLEEIADVGEVIQLTA
ncbi:MAG: MmgE/PrpD family protein [Desulfobacterales bacterium]|nr:MAG: MmgE/PrpD family protein [Desulfobacterales bacterium]